MAVQTGKEELGLLAVEAGVAASDADAAPPSSGRFGKRAVAAGAALLLAAALATAAVATAMHRRGVAQEAVPEGAHTEKLWSDHADYVAAPVSHVHHVYYEPTHEYHREVHHVFPTAAPGYHGDGQFATEVHHDALPAYHGDAYHGSYHTVYHQDNYHAVYHQDSYPGYHHHTTYYHTFHRLAWWQGPGFWWMVLAVILVALFCVGLYYFCFRGPSRGH